MFCNNCGTQNNTGDMYCRNCGTPLNQVNLNNNIANNNQINQVNLGNSFVNHSQGNMNYNNFNGYTNPTFYSQNIPNAKKSNTGLVIIIVGSIFISFLNLLESSPLDGTWDCSGSVGGDYVVTMKLEKGEKFTWSKYGDEQRNYVKGKYTYEKLDKQNANQNAVYYSIKLDGEEYVNNGEIQTEVYSSSYEAAVVTASGGEKQMAMANGYTGSIYYCYKR